MGMGKLEPVSLIQPITDFCTTYELRNTKNILNGWKNDNILWHVEIV